MSDCKVGNGNKHLLTEKIAIVMKNNKANAKQQRTYVGKVSKDSQNQGIKT